VLSQDRRCRVADANGLNEDEGVLIVDSDAFNTTLSCGIIDKFV